MSRSALVDEQKRRIGEQNAMIKIFEDTAEELVTEMESDGGKWLCAPCRHPSCTFESHYSEWTRSGSGCPSNSNTCVILTLTQTTYWDLHVKLYFSAGFSSNNKSCVCLRVCCCCQFVMRLIRQSVTPVLRQANGDEDLLAIMRGN